MTYYFGTTRFSVYAPGSMAWAISREMDEASYIASLYSEERLQARFDIFFNKAAPIYQLMSDRYPYRHILQFSNTMPTEWKNRLFDFAAKFPVLHLKETTNATGAVDSMLELMQGRESQMIALFRVDDDDVLSADYLDQLAFYAVPAFQDMAVSFGLGIAAIYFNGEFSEFCEVKQPLLSQGQAYIGKYDAALNKIHLPRIQRSHSQIDRDIPTILDSRRHAYLWVHHVDQDTRANKGDGSHGAILSKLKKLPQIPEHMDFAAKFPTFASFEHT